MSIQFSDYTLSEKQEQEYVKYKQAIAEQKRYIVHFVNLYKQAKNKSSFKRFDQAIRLLLENYNIEVQRVYRDGKIEFGNYKRDKYIFYVKWKSYDDIWADYTFGIIYATKRPPLTPEEIERQIEERKAKMAKAFIDNIEKFKGLNKADLNKVFKYKNYKGEIEEYKILGAIMRKRKMPIYCLKLDTNEHYSCAVSLLVEAKKYSKKLEKENNNGQI